MAKLKPILPKLPTLPRIAALDARDLADVASAAVLYRGARQQYYRAAKEHLDNRDTRQTQRAIETKQRFLDKFPQREQALIQRAKKRLLKEDSKVRRGRISETEDLRADRLYAERRARDILPEQEQANYPPQRSDRTMAAISALEQAVTQTRAELHDLNADLAQRRSLTRAALVDATKAFDQVAIAAGQAHERRDNLGIGQRLKLQVLGIAIASARKQIDSILARFDTPGLAQLDQRAASRPIDEGRTSMDMPPLEQPGQRMARRRVADGRASIDMPPLEQPRQRVTRRRIDDGNASLDMPQLEQPGQRVARRRIDSGRSPVHQPQPEPQPQSALELHRALGIQSDGVAILPNDLGSHSMSPRTGKSRSRGRS